MGGGLELCSRYVTAELGCDHNGPNDQYPRLVKGAQGSKVEVIRKLSQKQYFVRMTDSCRVGVATNLEKFSSQDFQKGTCAGIHAVSFFTAKY